MTTATDSRASEPVGSPQGASEDLAAARVHSAGDQDKAPGYKTPTGAEAKLQELIRSALDDVVGPMRDLIDVVLDATDLEDDAELARRVRAGVQAYATTRIGRELERESLASVADRGRPGPT